MISNEITVSLPEADLYSFVGFLLNCQEVFIPFLLEEGVVLDARTFKYDFVCTALSSPLKSNIDRCE